MLFIAAHDLRDAQAVLLCQHQQRVAAGEGQGQHGGIGRYHLLTATVGCHFVANDKTTAHGVIHAVGQFGTRRVQRHKAHAVGMEG